MGRVLDLAEKLWQGEVSTVENNPVVAFLGLEELRDCVAFVGAFGNVIAIDSGVGLLLVDTSGHLSAAAVARELRAWRDQPVRTAIFTHGHVDHTGGIKVFDADAEARGVARPLVIAHEAVATRFDRYRLTAGYNARINARQFQVSPAMWPTDYRYPDETYRCEHRLRLGDVELELHHDRGETDDHTWVWWPREKILCTGDLFIWASPNCGNPQKVQRYPLEWARALTRMAALGAELLLPGHGPPIIGGGRVRQALEESARLLAVLHDRTVELMNQGLRLTDILAQVQAPPELLVRPYLRPVYDEPSFIVRNLWRLYGGWWDGNPAHLKPARDSELAHEVAAMAGGAPALIERARRLAASGAMALACHFAEWAWLAARDDELAAIADARRKIYLNRSESESSLMARSIYRGAAEELHKPGGSRQR
jgi:alkyl sulfatase BDS1-like metallo-beta-lactamase superfamily hydrolase